jgi:hypothetical protein
MRANVRQVLLISAALAVSLSACEQIRETVGVEKKAPDEFSVVRTAPLSVPPTYDLRPPRPGARSVAQIDPRREAELATFGRQGAAATTNRAVADTAGEESLLRSLKVGNSAPDIRQQVDEESAILAADNRNFVERLMFWQTRPRAGAEVDAKKEQQRIQENAALGLPPETGSTPTIERKSNAGFSLF